MLWSKIFPGLLISVSLWQGGLVLNSPNVLASGKLSQLSALTPANSQPLKVSHPDKQPIDETLLEEAYQAAQYGNFRRSEQLLNQFIDRYPDYAPAYTYLGGVQINQGRIQQAIESLNRAIKLDPTAADAYNFLGLALAAQGRFSEAIEAWYTTIELNPDDIIAYDYLAALLQHQHRLEEAIAVQTQLADKLPSYWVVHVNLADLYRLTGNFSAAISEVELAIELAPEDKQIEALLYNVLGNALDDAGQFEQAEDAYLHSLALVPNDAMCHFDYGLALQRSGQLDQAAEHYRSALEIDPDYYPARESLEILEMYRRP